MNIRRIIREELDDLQWIRDVKTNDTIAKEIYDKLNWIKRPNVAIDYVTNPWNKLIPLFAVRKRNLSDSILPIISPGSFHNGFKDYVRENYGISDMSDIRKVYNKIKELMGDKIHRNINESEDFDWIKDVEPRLPLRVGTCLTFKHSKEEEEWVEDEYGNMIDHGKMNWHITSKFIDVYNDDKPTFSMVATDRMGESRQIFMEVEKVKELYEEGVYEPCKKQPYLKRVMKEESEDFDWIKDVEPKLTKGLILCPNHEKFRGGCKEVLKVDKVLSQSLIYLKDLETGNRYANTIKDMMQWLSDGEYIINYQPLKESDDLDWIRDIEPPNFNSLVGKALYFEPHIDNMVDLKRILEVLSSMGFTYGPWANDALWKDDEEIVGLYLDPRHNNIVYTDFISEDYEEHISEWAEKPVEVLDGWLTLGDFIYINKKKL